MDQSMLSLSKAMCWLLRYGAAEQGVDIDTDGSVLLDAMLALPNFSKYKKDDVLYVVKHSMRDGKPRFELVGTESHRRVKVQWGQSPEVLAKADDFEIIQTGSSVASKSKAGRPAQHRTASDRDVLRRIDEAQYAIVKEIQDSKVVERLAGLEERMAKLEGSLSKMVPMLEALIKPNDGRN